MENPRRYGEAPFKVAVVHGGPGAPGEMAPVARELSRMRGVLEPLQTQGTLSGQVEELKGLLQAQGDLPLVLIGYSWGAILSYILTADNPSLVSKLILVSSGVFDDAYVQEIKERRLARLCEEERARMDGLLAELRDPYTDDRDAPFAEIGALIAGADAYDPLPHTQDVISYQHDVFASVWGDAEELRSGDRLLEMGKGITCTVVAIHGDYDPHPWEGVKAPLEEVIGDFRFVLLKRCGHHPWYERHARDEFYSVLEQELI